MTGRRGITADGPGVWCGRAALKGERLRAHVDSMQRGSSARFVLPPPENATGDSVKVVQRIPVKFRFDEPPERVKPLVPGMSVIVILSDEAAGP